MIISSNKMKWLSILLLWLIRFLVVIQLFIWFLALGSGHNLPNDTQIAFLRNSIILIVLLIGVVFWRRNNH